MDVPPVLYNVVFGESVLNDATAIVLFRTLEEFYETPLSWGTVPLMFWRFFVIAAGSIIIGKLLSHHCTCISFVYKMQTLAGVQAILVVTLY